MLGGAQAVARIDRECAKHELITKPRINPSMPAALHQSAEPSMPSARAQRRLVLRVATIVVLVPNSTNLTPLFFRHVGAGPVFRIMRGQMGTW